MKRLRIKILVAEPPQLQNVEFTPALRLNLIVRYELGSARRHAIPRGKQSRLSIAKKSFDPSSSIRSPSNRAEDNHRAYTAKLRFTL